MPRLLDLGQSFAQSTETITEFSLSFEIVRIKAEKVRLNEDLGFSSRKELHIRTTGVLSSASGGQSPMREPQD